MDAFSKGMNYNKRDGYIPLLMVAILKSDKIWNQGRCSSRYMGGENVIERIKVTELKWPATLPTRAQKRGSERTADQRDAGKREH